MRLRISNIGRKILKIIEALRKQLVPEEKHSPESKANKQIIQLSRSVQNNNNNNNKKMKIDCSTHVINNDETKC